jgi:hypothetical protein
MVVGCGGLGGRCPARHRCYVGISALAEPTRGTNITTEHDYENHNKHCNCRRLPFVHRPSLGAGAWADVAGGAVTVRMRRTRNASAAIEDDMDIVIRLRKETSPLMHDAAREIERLRAELTRLLAKHEQTADVLAASNEQNGD